MRIALIAPPFIRVPPRAYGGTELFVAHLAQGLCDDGHDVVVYANGESKLPCEVRWVFEREDWPPKAEGNGLFKNLEHFAWAIRDAVDDDFDVIHVNDAFAVPLLRFLRQPAVHTLHHPHEPALSALYQAHPDVTYVAISDAQKRSERLPHIVTVRHGLKVDEYRYEERKSGYVAFLGRMAPVKAPHLAIEAARRAGVPLKLAGEVQPMFADYFETRVKPFIDGKLIEFAGEATLDIKNDLLSNASALLFPIQWEEPFGLVMIEAMACGTPVLAFAGGAVPEVVADGVTGWICRDVEEMAARTADTRIDPRACREHVEQRFSLERMVRDYERVYRGCIAAATVPVLDPAPASRL